MRGSVGEGMSVCMGVSKSLGVCNSVVNVDSVLIPAN